MAAGAFGLVMVVLHSVAVYGLMKRRLYQLCRTVSVISWFMLPFGTPLGIASYVVLKRTSVRKLFASEGGMQPD